MITGRQIRAARGLLDISQDELAKFAGITKQGISKIEDGSVQPREGTLADIKRVFDQHGIEFLDDEGVRIRKNQIRMFNGRTEYRQFLDHIYDAVKNGGKIRQFNLSDGKNLSHADEYAAIHLERMAKVSNLDARVLTIEGDMNFPASYCQYRWLDRANKILIPYYVYEDYLSMPIYRSADHVEIISIRSKLLAGRYIEQFDLFWDSAIIPKQAGRP